MLLYLEFAGELVTKEKLKENNRNNNNFFL